MTRIREREDQSTRDALADAETLRTLACGMVTWVRSPEEYAVTEAMFHGTGAAYTAHFQGAAYVDCSSLAGEQARKAARAAFRACPGLRGKE